MADIPDFSIKQTFPIAAAIQAYQNRDKMALEQQQMQAAQLSNSIAAIGQIGKSLQDRKRSIAQAMTIGQQFGMSPEEVQGLTPEQVIDVQKQKSGNTNLGQAMLLQKVINDPKALDNPAFQALAQNLFKSQTPTAATQTPMPSNSGGFFKNFKSALGFNPTPTNTGMTPDGSSAIAPSGGTPPPTVSSGTVTGMGGTPPPTPPPSGGIDLSKLTAGKGTTALAVKLAAQNAQQPVMTQAQALEQGTVPKGTHIIGQSGGSDPSDPKTQHKYEQEYIKTLQKNLSNRSGGLGLEDSKVNQAIHLRSLINQYYDPKTGQYNIPPSQHAELALGLARLVSPTGQVGVELMQELRQGSGREALAKMLIAAGADPTQVGGPTQSIAKLFVDSVDRQGQVAEQNRNKYLDDLHGMASIDLAPERRDRLDKIKLGNSFTETLAKSPDKQGPKLNPDLAHLSTADLIKLRKQMTAHKGQPQ